jgi:YidC/Oxa1 family membrane protein insertase
VASILFRPARPLSIVDKKNLFLGSLLMAAALATLFLSQRSARQNPSPAAIRHEVARQEAVAATDVAPGHLTEPDTGGAAFITTHDDHAGAEIVTLENSFIQVRFTDFGGAVRDVAFKKYPAALGAPDPFIFNQLHADPILAFVGMPGLDRGTRFRLVAKTATEVVYRAVFDGQLEVTRRYVLSPDAVTTTDPYRLRVETQFRNLGAQASRPMRVALALGTAAPANALDLGIDLTTGVSNGDSQTFVRRSSLEAGNGVMGIGASDAKALIATPGPVAWATVKDKFFASILTPDAPAAALVTRRVKLLTALPDEDRKAYGLTGTVEFDVKAIPGHGETTLDGQLYVGPKEYHRLSNADVFKRDEDRIMDYGWFRLPAAILLTLMTWMHGWTLNWGVAIILTTLSLKFAFLPLTLSASRSAKRMQKIQPELKALREKFKDSPQKQQTATMELFKRNKVNPMGGCLPVLITIPFFFGFYRMLASAAELRFAPFLWAHNLSAPDTVASIGHDTLPLIGTLNINILPVLLCATVFAQMRLTPQPTVDNAQARMMKFMPFLFMVFCYNYSCALSLYSTVNGLFTIGQQLVINRMKDDPVAVGPVAVSGKPTKNVTPKRKG